jgi:hypothetical protein
LEVILDDYFSGRKRRAGYQIAKDEALHARQRRIHSVWNELTKGIAGMDLTKLHILQELIEAPYEETVHVPSENGVATTHKVTIDGFDGRTLAAETAKKKQSTAPSMKGPPPTATQRHHDGLSNSKLNKSMKEQHDVDGLREGKVIECLAKNLQRDTIDKENRNIVMPMYKDSASA